MSKNDFFDKNDYKTNSEWKLQLTLGWYLSPTIDFDNMIHITAFLKPTYLRGNLKWPLKCWKMMFLTKVITKNNSNSKLWPILAGYLTLILHFNNMIQDAGEPKITPLIAKKCFWHKISTQPMMIENFGMFWLDISAQQWILTTLFILLHLWNLSASGETQNHPPKISKECCFWQIWLHNQ